MQETKNELVNFTPASREWFDGNLHSSAYFIELDSLEKRDAFVLFCQQVKDDARQQLAIINQNFSQRPNVSQEIINQARLMINQLNTSLLSPPLMTEDCPLESLVDTTWTATSNSSQLTIPNLFENFVHEESLGFEYSPPTENEDSHTYARYDIVKHPRFKEYLDAIKKLVLNHLPDNVNSENVHSLLVRTGSSILPDLLQILNIEGRKKVLSPQNERFSIHILSDSPYFEAGNAIEAIKPIHALSFDQLAFSPPHSEGISGPSVNVVSTHTDAKHIYKIDRSLKEGGIDCYYVEPIGNNPAMDVPDIKKAVDTIRSAIKISPNARKVFVLIDSTLMAGGFDLKSIFDGKDFLDINLVVIESINKYLSYGTNKANIGFAYGLGPDTEWLFDSLKKTVKMKGLPDIRSILSVPVPDETILEKRRQRFKHNYEFLSKELFKNLSQQIEITHPSLENHPQHDKANDNYDFQGSILFIKFENDEAYLKVEELLKSSKIISLGTSYGFNTTRAEVIKRSTNSEIKKPVALRISVGTENFRKLILIRDELISVLNQAQA